MVVKTAVPRLLWIALQTDGDMWRLWRRPQSALVSRSVIRALARRDPAQRAAPLAVSSTKLLVIAGN